MKHFVYEIKSLKQLKTIVRQLAQDPVVATASAVLLHVFTYSTDTQYIDEMKQVIKAALPQVIIVGASAVGQIIKDKIRSQTTAISVLCFATGRVFVKGASYSNLAEGKTIEGLRNFVTDKAELQGVEVLANVKGLDNLSFLSALDVLPEEIPVFGCGADADDDGNDTLVFDDNNYYTHGAIIVLYCGKQLHIQAYISVGWKTLGKSMTITQTSDNDMSIVTIDHKPAVEVYKKYLKIENNAQFAASVQEFPLIANRHGHNMARVAVASTSKGTIQLAAKVHEGEIVRIGYADPAAIISAVRVALQKTAAFQPEGLLAYSCVTRKVFLKEYANEDNKPFNDLAPVCGFHTFGEIFRQGGHVDIYNCTLVSVIMREGDISIHNQMPQPRQDELQGHMSMVQRLVRFVEATTLELEDANKQLSIIATHDQLTKLLNRGEIEKRFKIELQRVKRGEENMSVIMMDVDNFKDVNDTLGHSAGDTVLRQVSAILQACVREYDLVGRWGGEEFLILLLGYNPPEPTAIAERIRKLVEAADFGFDRKITVSLGVTSARNNEIMMDIYRRADAALYEAKHKGKNCVVKK